MREFILNAYAIHFDDPLYPDPRGPGWWADLAMSRLWYYEGYCQRYVTVHGRARGRLTGLLLWRHSF